jgi:hypothetical protein
MLVMLFGQRNSGLGSAHEMSLQIQNDRSRPQAELLIGAGSRIASVGREIIQITRETKHHTEYTDFKIFHAGTRSVWHAAA